MHAYMSMCMGMRKYVCMRSCMYACIRKATKTCLIICVFAYVFRNSLKFSASQRLNARKLIFVNNKQAHVEYVSFFLRIASHHKNNERSTSKGGMIIALEQLPKPERMMLSTLRLVSHRFID